MGFLSPFIILVQVLGSFGMCLVFLWEEGGGVGGGFNFLGDSVLWVICLTLLVL